MVVWACDKCEYHTKIKRDILRHMNKKTLCRNEIIMVDKKMANVILATNSEHLFLDENREAVENTIQQLEEELEQQIEAEELARLEQQIETEEIQRLEQELEAKKTRLKPLLN